MDKIEELLREIKDEKVMVELIKFLKNLDKYDEKERIELIKKVTAIIEKGDELNG